jgi:hypothetical protein
VIERLQSTDISGACFNPQSSLFVPSPRNPTYNKDDRWNQSLCWHFSWHNQRSTQGLQLSSCTSSDATSVVIWRRCREAAPRYVHDRRPLAKTSSAAHHTITNEARCARASRFSASRKRMGNPLELGNWTMRSGNRWPDARELS